MNQSELINTAAEKLFVTKAETKEALEFILNRFITDLKKGERIHIRGFGSLYKVKRKKKKGFNFKKGKTISIPERNSVEFRPAPALLKKINK